MNHLVRRLTKPFTRTMLWRIKGMPMIRSICINLWIPKLLLLFILRLPGIAQTPIHYNITTKDGLPSNCVYDVFQDKEGYYWFGTDNGVARFDGAHFDNFTIADGLTDNEVFLIKGDSKGRVWFLTSNGQLCYYWKGKIHNPLNTPLLGEIKEKIWFSGFAEDRFHNLWIATYNGKVYKIKGNTLIRSPEGKSFFQMPGDHLISEITLDKDGMAWVVSRGGAICLSFDPANIRIPKVLDISILENGIYLQNQDMCYASQGNLIYKRVGGTEKIFKSLLQSKPSHITQTWNGDIWITTLKELIRFKGGIKDSLEQETLFKGLPVGRVRMDKQGNLWLATSNKGVWLVPHLDRRHYDQVFDFEKEVQAVYVDDHQKVWLGGDKGNLSVLENGKIRKIELPASIRNLQVRGRIKTIGYLGKDSIYVAYEENLLILHKDRLVKAAWMGTKAFMNYAGCYWIGSSTNCYVLSHDQFNKLTNNNLNPTPKDKVNFQVTLRAMGKLSGYRISGFIGDEKGIAWISTAQGLSAIDTKTWKPYALPSRFPILSKPILCLQSNSRQELLIGIQSYGLGILKNETLRILPSSKYLNKGNIRKIVVQNDSMTWLCTNKGLFLLKNAQQPNQYHIQPFSTEHGLVSTEIHDLAIGKEYLYVGGNTGLSLIPLNSIHNKTEQSPEIFQPVLMVNGMRIDSVQKEEITSGQNEVRITFGCTDLRYFGNVEFRYRLKPENEWTTIKDFQVVLNSLGAGLYQPEFQAKTPGSEWGKSTFLPSFEVLPLVWKRMWFLLSVIAATIFGTVLIARYVITSQFEKITLDHQLTEANLKALRAQIKPHFLFNAINAVQQFFLYNHRDEGLEFLGKFSQLMRNILESSEQQFHPIDSEMSFLKDYLAIEKERIGPGLNYVVDCSENLKGTNAQIPTMLLQPLVENALWHGIMKKTKPEGNVFVGMSKERWPDPDKKKSTSEDEYLKIIVEDDGIGRTPQEKPSRQKKDSFGIKSLEWKVALLMKKYKTRIDFRIIDLKDDTDKPIGTRIEMLLPLNWNLNTNENYFN